MSPIFIAIDTPDISHAEGLAHAVRGHARGLKLGLEFFCANGPAGVRQMAAFGMPLFLDLKLHDIPNTVAKALESLRSLGPAVVTVHAAGGRAMLQAAKAAVPESTKIVAVTVLTSLDEADLSDSGVSGSAAEQVRRLASLAQDAGIDGIVCSGAEVAAASAAWPQGYFVVPGIRPEGSGVGDQKRVVTPLQAMRDGASMLVIGRPVTGAADPAEAIRAISDGLRPQSIEV
jgi:orotidine-5'-phosphate decarboxylase